MDGTNQANKIQKIALVLEGGGMRGIYTTGVLDAFLDQNIFFEYVIGVSAGASHALSYLSRQKDRARRVNVDYCRRRDYMGLHCLLHERSLFGMDLLFKKLPYKYEPYDFEAFEKNANGYYAVATNLLTGSADYLAPRKKENVLACARASCSLPFVSKPVFINDIPYLDGGVGDSIPVRRALTDGNQKAVVVLTQPRGYRKTIGRHNGFTRFFYRRYPEFAQAIELRNERYNETLTYIAELEKAGTVFVIAPQPQEGLKRLERDPDLLNGLHRSGYTDTNNVIPQLRAFIT